MARSPQTTRPKGEAGGVVHDLGTCLARLEDNVDTHLETLGRVEEILDRLWARTDLLIRSLKQTQLRLERIQARQQEEEE